MHAHGIKDLGVGGGFRVFAVVSGFTGSACKHHTNKSKDLYKELGNLNVGVCGGIHALITLPLPVGVGVAKIPVLLLG